MKTTHPLLLASTSKYRAALLTQLGWPFECVSPGVDEGQFKNQKLTPEKLASELARLKAEAVFNQRPDACVIGSDQVCDLDGTILSKPGNFEKAMTQLKSMQGKSHRLLTAVCILSPSGNSHFLSRTVLAMRKLTDAEIKHYLDSDSPFDCAGSYKLESSGIRLFEKIDMDDHTAIIGLPLIELTNHLLKLGFAL